MAGRIITLLFFLSSFGCQAAESCLNYEPEKVMVSGLLERMTFPGRPNYESVESGDEAETGFYLNLQMPVCTVGEKLSPDAYPQAGITVIQLNLDTKGYDELRPYLGKQVTLNGKLFAAFTGHHHAPVLIQDVSVVKPNAAIPNQPERTH